MSLREIGEACDALGLTRHATLSLSAAGFVDGVAAGLRQDLQRGNDGDLTLFAARARPSDLGLLVVQGGTWVLPRAPSFETGDATFDGLLSARAPRPCHDLARAALTAEAREVMLAMVRDGRPWVTDDVVGFSCSSLTLTAEETTTHLRRCAALALVLDRGAEDLDVHPVLVDSGHVDALVRAARERGMSLQRNALYAHGALATHDLWVRLRVEAGRGTGVAPLDALAEPAGYRVRLRFHEPLGLGLGLRPARAFDRVKDLLGRGDLTLGDEAFDRAWTITAADPDAARDALRDEARALLQRLASLGMRVHLDDRGLEARGPLDPRGEAIGELLWSLDGLRGALRPGARGGAYR